MAEQLASLQVRAWRAWVLAGAPGSKPSLLLLLLPMLQRPPPPSPRLPQSAAASTRTSQAHEIITLATALARADGCTLVAQEEAEAASDIADAPSSSFVTIGKLASTPLDESSVGRERRLRLLVEAAAAEARADVAAAYAVRFEAAKQEVRGQKLRGASCCCCCCSLVPTSRRPCVKFRSPRRWLLRLLRLPRTPRPASQ
jgi:hypothetical protein